MDSMLTPARSKIGKWKGKGEVGLVETGNINFRTGQRERKGEAREGMKTNEFIVSEQFVSGKIERVRRFPEKEKGKVRLLHSVMKPKGSLHHCKL